ncbi:MAG: VWA domain-containing protein [Roseburia sp.]|nr:VWA domain-containing protein [Roseburia sp.]
MKEKFCRNCGSPIKQGQSFCTVCGKKIQETQESGKEQKKDRKWKIAFGICFIVAVVIIAGLIVLLVGKQQNLRPDDKSSQSSQISQKEVATETEQTTEKTDAQDATIDIAQIDTSNYPKISVYFTVRDLDGNDINHLDKSQFTLSELENNKEKKQNFSLDYYKDRVNQQKTVTFAMDISGSMDGILGEEFDAADYILGLMKEKSGYCVAMTSFNSDQQELYGFTTDIDKMREVCTQDREVEGSTALYDTLTNALYQEVHQTGQKYILAFTDGADNCSVSATADSVISLSEQYHIPIYLISVSGENETDVLQNIANASGGKYFEIKDISELQGCYEQIFEQQQAMNVLTYTTTQKNTDTQIRLSYTASDYRGQQEAQYCAQKPDIDENISNAIIKKVKASDALDPMTDNNGKTATYDPENAIDGDYRTAWVEGTDGAGIGSWIELDFDGVHKINGIEISNGYKKEEGLYHRNLRIKKVRIYDSDGNSKVYTLHDQFVGTDRIDFDEPLETSSLRLEIVSVYKDKQTKHMDTCLTDFSIY